MLREMKNVRQEESSGGSRRWFTDDNMYLIVWLSPDKDIVGFQLCYDTSAHEHSLTWHRDRGYAHNAIDSGEQNPSINRSPILISDGAFPSTRVVADFDERAIHIDQSIAQFVRKKLLECQ